MICAPILCVCLLLNPCRPYERATAHMKAAEVFLTYPDGSRWYGGVEVLGLYHQLRSTRGWWNRDGELTLEEFNGLLILHEASLLDLPAERLIAEVVARHLWAGGIGGNPPYCPASPCWEGVFNYWAAYSASAHRLVDAFVYGGKPIAEYVGPNLRSKLGDSVMVRSAWLGRIVLNPPDSWRVPDNDAPFGWGNSEVWCGPVLYRAGSFLVYTPNQSASCLP